MTSLQLGDSMESRTRTIVKAIIWNAIGLAVMAGIGLAMTGSLALGGAMAVLNTSVGLVTYILYERVWAGIRWGRHA